MTKRATTGEMLVYAAIILASLPVRLGSMHTSLWLDEAWVANSVLTPSWKEMFYYSQWDQVSPSLYLALTRLLTSVFGYSEPALRILPLTAGLLALPVLAIALRKLFGRAAALCGVALLAANFWAVKYSQQVKQYGTDVLAGATIVFLLVRYFYTPSQRNFAWLVGGVFILTFLANTAVFAIPSALLLIILRLERPGAFIRSVRVWVAGALLALCVALNYLVFVHPNQDRSLVAFWAASCLDARHLLTSAQKLFMAFAELLVPPISPVAVYAGAMAALVLLAGACMAVFQAVRGSDKAVLILLAGPLPIAVAAAYSMTGSYPVQGYPRMLVWALPGCAVLLATAVEPLFGTGPRTFYSLAAAALVAVIVLQVVITRSPRPEERNREAMQLLSQSMNPSDLLFVYSGVLEQYEYYARLQGWTPPHAYLGNFGWPCCARNTEKRASSPGIHNFAADLRQAVQVKQPGGRVWMFLPSAQTGHWSAGLRERLNLVPEIMRGVSCHEILRAGFDQSLVLGYECL